MDDWESELTEDEKEFLPQADDSQEMSDDDTDYGD